MLDITEPLMQLAVTLISVLTPVIVAAAAVWAKKALAALEVEKYADALKKYDENLYSAVMDAGEAAAAKLLDSAQNFAEKDVRNYIIETALEVADVFEKRAGVRVDFSSERLDDLIELAVVRAREEVARQRS